MRPGIVSGVIDVPPEMRQSTLQTSSDPYAETETLGLDAF
jgi:hypothetical protein